MTCVPATVVLPMGITSKFESSDDRLMVMFPLPAWMFSSNVMTRLAPTATLVSLSEGEVDERLGGVVSAPHPPPQLQ